MGSLQLVRCLLGSRLSWGKCLKARLQAAEASCVSASTFSAFRAATVGSVWSSRMPLAKRPVVLNLPDGPVGTLLSRSFGPGSV